MRLIGRNDSVIGLDVAHTALGAALPELMRAIRAVHLEGTPQERRARVQRDPGEAPLELTAWICPLPLPGHEIHLLIRVEELR